MSFQWALFSLVGLSVLLSVVASVDVQTEEKNFLSFELSREESKAEKLIREGRWAEFRSLLGNQQTRVENRLGGEGPHREPFPEHPTRRPRPTRHPHGPRRGPKGPRLPPHSTPSPTPFNGNVIPVLDYTDINYVVTVGIGTPPQEFRLVADTITSATWVVDSACSPEKPEVCPDYCKNDWCSFTCDAACCAESEPNSIDGNQCDGKNKFNSTDSETFTSFQRKWTAVHNRLGALGNVGSDSFTLFGDNQTLTTEDVTFAQATHIDSRLADAPIDGVLGLSLSANDHLPSALDTILKTNKMDRSVVITLDKSGGMSDGQVSGELTIGGYDGKHCRGMAYGQFVIGSSWTIPANSYGINGKQTPGRVTANIDSTVPFNYGPKEVVDKLVEATNATFDEEIGLYTLSCKTKVKFNLGFGGQNIVLQDKALIMQLSPRVCALAFRPFSEDAPIQSDFVLGTPLFTSYCVWFDYGIRRVNIMNKA